jgi:hypothetical protein
MSNAVGISDPITKLCNIKELAKKLLAKIQAKKSVVSVEETTQIAT